MSRWNVSDHNGTGPVFIGSLYADEYDEALALACDWWPGQVAEVSAA